MKTFLGFWIKGIVLMERGIAGNRERVDMFDINDGYVLLSVGRGIEREVGVCFRKDGLG